MLFIHIKTSSGNVCFHLVRKSKKCDSQITVLRCITRHLRDIKVIDQANKRIATVNVAWEIIGYADDEGCQFWFSEEGNYFETDIIRAHCLKEGGPQLPSFESTFEAVKRKNGWTS